jgi:hypothetical protein
MIDESGHQQYDIGGAAKTRTDQFGKGHRQSWEGSRWEQLNVMG